MAKNKSELKQTQEKLVDQLSDNIIDMAAPLVDTESDLTKAKPGIVERLQFESNLALNELVTRFASGQAAEEKPEMRTFERFGKNFRAQHILMFVSVIILIITGMPLKFPELGLSKFIIITMLGGLENSTLLHRVGAVGLIIVSFWHLFYTILTRIGRRDFVLMIPMPKDAKDLFHTLRYFFGKRSSGPKMGRFSFIEKFDYWAVYWGMVIMIGSGSILWFKEMFPKFIYDIGREAHSDEGLLATLAIVVWHFYNVHFNPESFPMSWVWWHGKLNEDEMKHHHPLEYAEIMEVEKKQIADEMGAEKNTVGINSKGAN